MSARHGFTCECGEGRGNHPLRHLRLDHRSACIDVHMAPLVMACWKHGIETTESCQEFEGPNVDGGPHTVFLAFASTTDYLRFGSLVLRGGSRDHLYDKIQSGSEWAWSCCPIEFDDTSGYPNYHHDTPIVASWSCSVVFPHTDLKVAVRRLVAGAALPG